MIQIPKTTWGNVSADSAEQGGDNAIKIPHAAWGALAPDPAANRDSTVKIPDNAWTQLTGIMQPVPVRTFKGVNKLDPFTLADAFATDINNLASSEFPALTTRPGYSVTATLGAAITGLGAWKGTQLLASAGGQIYRYVANTFSSILSGLNTTSPVTICNFKGNFAGINAIFSNGSDSPRKYDGNTVSVLAGAPAGINYICTHDNRLYGAVGNTIHHTALSKGEDWTTAGSAGSGQIVVENSNGESIVALKAGIGHVVAWLGSSMHELWGTGPRDYRLQVIASDIGIVNNRCSVMLQGVLYFLDKQGIYQYSGGVRPDKRFSMAIQDYVDKINNQQLAKCAMGTDGKRLYISFPTGSATDNNITLEYDPIFDTWHVWDLAPSRYTESDYIFYFSDPSGKVMSLGGTTDNGKAISYRWVSKPFGSASLAQSYQWHRLWYVAEVPIGSTMDVYLSKSAGGDDDWTLVQSIPAESLQTGRTVIPIKSVSQANWVRVKFEGIGVIKLHEFARQQREIPLN